MAIRSAVIMKSVASAVAVAAGLPLIVALFLGVVAYCYAEWLHETLLSGHSMPSRPMRTIEANP